MGFFYPAQQQIRCEWSWKFYSAQCLAFLFIFFRSLKHDHSTFFNGGHFCTTKLCNLSCPKITFSLASWICLSGHPKFSPLSHACLSQQLVYLLSVTVLDHVMFSKNFWLVPSFPYGLKWTNLSTAVDFHEK